MELSIAERIFITSKVTGGFATFVSNEATRRYHVILHFNGNGAVECYVDAINNEITGDVFIVKYFEEAIGADPIGSLKAIGDMYGVAATINLAEVSDDDRQIRHESIGRIVD